MEIGNIKTYGSSTVVREACRIGYTASRFRRLCALQKSEYPSCGKAAHTWTVAIQKDVRTVIVFPMMDIALYGHQALVVGLLKNYQAVGATPVTEALGPSWTKMDTSLLYITCPSNQIGTCSIGYGT